MTVKIDGGAFVMHEMIAGVLITAFIVVCVLAIKSYAKKIAYRSNR